MARVRRLHPEPAELDADALLAALELPRDTAGGRPHVAINMVASVDGRTTVGGRSAPLTSPFDRALFHALRAATDAVMVGPRTLSAERYQALVREPERRRARVEHGLSPIPLACVVTRSGDVDLSVPLFDDPDQVVVLFTPERPAALDCAAEVRIVTAEPHELEPRAVMRRVRAEHGVRSLVCEGGATMNAALLRAGVVDEIFLSVAPVIAGGSDPLAIFAGRLDAPVSLELGWMLEADGTTFLRYGVSSSG